MTYLNLRAHRGTCEDYKRVASQQQPPVSDEPDSLAMYSCPYCDSDYSVSKFELLEAHILTCKLNKERERTDDRLVGMEGRWIADDLDHISAFEAWCWENDR